MSTQVEKVCPVVLRVGASGLEILIFDHPIAGSQLIKGTLGPGESVGVAALRELAEESGISSGVLDRDLGRSFDIVADEIWHFVLIGWSGLADQWDFETQDDHGHRFSFGWWPINLTASQNWDPRYIRALHHIHAAL